MACAVDHGAHGELGLERHADLADEDQVKANAERLRNLSRDWNAAAWQRQDGRFAFPVPRERRRKSATRIRSIPEHNAFPSLGAWDDPPVAALSTRQISAYVTSRQGSLRM